MESKGHKAVMLRADVLLTAALLVAWPAMWLLWPNVVAGPPSRSSGPRPTRFVLRGKPSSSRSGRELPFLALPPGEHWDDYSDSLPPLRTVRVNTDHILGSPGPVVSSAARPSDMLGDRTAPSRYLSLSSEERVFTPRVPAASNGLVVAGINGQRAYDFDVDSLAADKSLQPDAAWTLKASVELDGQGQVSHVFVESSSGEPAVDAAVARALRRGRAQPAGTDVEQVAVTVRWPGLGTEQGWK